MRDARPTRRYGFSGECGSRRYVLGDGFKVAGSGLSGKRIIDFFGGCLVTIQCSALLDCMEGVNYFRSIQLFFFVLLVALRVLGLRTSNSV